MFNKPYSISIRNWKRNQHNIRDLVKIAYITAVAMIISNFHIPIPIHGIEVEKIGISKVVYFVLFDIVNLKLLIWSITILPILENLFHGHNFVMIPFEIIFNNLILITMFVVWRMTVARNYVGKRIIFCVVSLLLVVGIKVTYDIVVLTIFTPFWTNKNLVLWNLGIFIVINVIKYTTILSIILYLKKRGEFKKIYHERKN